MVMAMKIHLDEKLAQSVKLFVVNHDMTVLTCAHPWRLLIHFVIFFHPFVVL